MNLAGKTVVITGAGRGIGESIARKLSHSGANLALADIDTQGLADTAKAITDGDQSPLLLDVDVQDKRHVEAMVERTVSHFGDIDILFSNAGIIKVQNFLDIDESSFDQIMAVNAKGVFLCGQAVAKHMVRHDHGGRIINTASLAARMGIADMAAYCASKAAVMSLTRSMALALAPHNINVNALAPGIVDTDMWSKIDSERSAIHGQPAGVATSTRVGAIPLGRAAQSEDVANMAEFLVGPGADYITGQTFNIDGGALPS